MNKKDVCFAYWLVLQELKTCVTEEHLLDAVDRLSKLRTVLAKSFNIPLEQVGKIVANFNSTTSFVDMVEMFEEHKRKMLQKL